MAIVRYAGDRFAGLSSDTKPTNVLEGAIFNELDTGFIYHFYDGSWSEIDYVDSSTFDDLVDDFNDLDIFRNIANSGGAVQFSADGATDTLRFASSGASSVAFDGATNTITVSSTDTQLSESQVQDFAWDVLTGTQTLITVSYNSSTNEASFVVDNDLSNYDNSNSGFIVTETDPTVPQHVKDITSTQISNWDAAHGWGDHSVEGYLTDITGEAIGGLNDVTITTPQDEEILAYDANANEWINVSIGDITPAVTELDHLNDVTLTTPATDNLLQYDGSQWVNITLASLGIPSVLDDLGDVDINSPASGQFIVYDGNDWSNTLVNIEDLNNVNTVTATTGQFMIYDGSEWVNDDLPSLAITEVYTVADITARDALTPEMGDVAVVLDASADGDVRSGSASYIYDGTDWQKIKGPDLTAAGNDTWIQYNDEDDFGASGDFRFNDTTARLTLEGQMTFTENTGITPSNPGDDSTTMYVQTRVDGPDTITEFMAKTGDGDVIIASYVQ